MTDYLIDFSFKVNEYGSVVLPLDEASGDLEDQAYNYVRDTYEGATDIEIEGIKEMTKNG